MRHYRLPLLAGVVALGLTLAVASCSVSTSVGSYDVTYRVNVANVLKTTGGQDSVIGGLPVTVKVATIDSILYSPGTGKCTTTCNVDSTLIKVTNPGLSALGIYTTELFLPSGATVQATLYGSGTAAGTAQFAVLWMTASGTMRTDSLTATTAAATKFTISLNKRTL
jgi:hypothetical protein